MAGETVVTVIGNVTADPELRFTATGLAVASFTIASNRRTYNRETNSWENSDTLFLRCTAWRSLAENIAETVTRGMRVIAQGSLRQNEYETRDGERRTSIELTVDEIGPSLRNATAKVSRKSSVADDTFSASSTSAFSQTNDDPFGANSDLGDDIPPF